MIYVVKISKQAEKELRKLPRHIVEALMLWVHDVETSGLEIVRKIPGYHDEPLKGDRKGQRSIKLNRSYRAIYVVNSDGTIDFVEVKEVNKHKY